MDYENLKEKIAKAQELWDFELMDKLYFNNLQLYKELKNDYVNFLYNTALLDKLYKILQDSSELESFSEIKQKLEIIFNAKNKEEALKQNLPSEIAYGYILNSVAGGGQNSLLNDKLDSTQSLELFKNYLFFSDNVLLKSYIAAALIDYFSLQDYSEGEKFFVPLQYESAPYEFLCFIYSQMKLEGARRYWNLYNKKMQRFLRDNMPLPKKKIAICLYGVFRGAWVENLQEVIDTMATPLDADVFLFSWDEYQEWPSLMGGYYWANRALKVEIAKECPPEIATHNNFRENMPHTYKALCSEYNLKIPQSTMDSILKKNPCIKSYKLESQQKFLHGFWSAKLYYGMYATFKLMESYEFSKKSLYDIVIICRSDIRPSPIKYEALEGLGPNEIADEFMNWGSGSGCFVAHREAAKNYVSLWKHKGLLEQNRLLLAYGNNHELGLKWPAILGLNITKSIISFDFYHTTALAGIRFPCVNSEIEKDFKELREKGALSEEVISKIAAFFALVRENYKLPSSEARIESRIGALSPARRRVRGHLAYRLGRILVRDSKSFSGILKMPFSLANAIIKARKVKRDYEKKVRLDPSLKLPPLESYHDYNECLKDKESITYKLGEALIKVVKGWYKGGLFRLYFDIKRILGEGR